MGISLLIELMLDILHSSFFILYPVTRDFGCDSPSPIVAAGTRQLVV
jgi:hypothetical protein